MHKRSDDRYRKGGHRRSIISPKGAAETGHVVHFPLSRAGYCGRAVVLSSARTFGPNRFLRHERLTPYAKAQRLPARRALCPRSCNRWPTGSRLGERPDCAAGTFSTSVDRPVMRSAPSMLRRATLRSPPRATGIAIPRESTAFHWSEPKLTPPIANRELQYLWTCLELECAARFLSTGLFYSAGEKSAKLRKHAKTGKAT